MINFIDEEKLALELIKSPRLINSNTETYIIAYIKYLKNNGYTKPFIKDELEKFINNHYKGYVFDCERYIDYNINRYARMGDCEYNKPRRISITKDELEYLMNIENKTYEDILFVILVLCKVGEGNICEESYKFIFDLSKYRYSPTRKPKYKQAVRNREVQRDNTINRLSDSGHITLTNDGIVCNFINNNSKVELEFELSEQTYENLVLHYHKFCGDDTIVICSRCGGCSIQKVGAERKYCDRCAKLVNSEKTNNNFHKRKNEI